MSGLILRGIPEHVPGLTIANWQDDAKLRLRMGEDGRKRPPTVRWIRAVVLHTTRGLPFSDHGAKPRVLPGAGPKTEIARDTNAWWSTNGQHGGAHLIVDYNGDVACLADLVAEETYHAGPVNPYSIGVEIAQRLDGSIFEAQLATVVTLCGWLTERLRIQRQIPGDCMAKPGAGYYQQGILIPRAANGGSTLVGVYGHRDVTRSRGFGDPGDHVFQALEENAGFEGLDMRHDEDLDVWKRRQAYLGTGADGIPGPATAAAVATWQEENHYPTTGVLSRLQREELDDATSR